LFIKAAGLTTPLEIYHPSHYPSDFVCTRKDQELVRKTIGLEYPDAKYPETFPVLPSASHGILKIPTPLSELSQDPDHPLYLLLRLDSLISWKNQGDILAAWDELQVTTPRHLIKREEARSATPAYHWGVWEATAPRPYITSESHRQTPEAILAIDKLLRLVKKFVIPKVIKTTKEYLPHQWKRQEEYVNKTYLEIRPKKAE
jgi:hypothetical protein